MKSIVKTISLKFVQAELDLINSTNPYPITGQSWVMTETLDELKEMYGFDLKEGDFIVSYDFNDEFLTRKLNGQYVGSQLQIWCDWLDDEFFPYLHGHMKKLGYEAIDDHDGSGGGLHYGGLHFTKS